jgi:cell division topological specificity factor
MLDFLSKFFRRDEPSKSLAKDRLRFVLMSDRISLAPETFDAMKGEMLSVLQRYLEIDERGLDVHFENAERRFMLLANIPVNNVKTLDQIRSETLRAPEPATSEPASDDTARKGRTNGVATPRRRRRRRSQRNGAASAPAIESASNGEASPVTGIEGVDRGPAEDPPQ